MTELSTKQKQRGMYVSLPRLVIIFISLYGLNLFLWQRDLWVQDEARYGTVIREMVTTHSWLVPTVDGRFYPDKPPLYFWLALLQCQITGLNVISLRLLTFFSTAAFAISFFVFVRRILDSRRAIWSSLIWMTSILFLLMGNIVRMDMLMAFLVVLAVDFFKRGIDENRRGLALCGYLVAFLAGFVKGPLGFAFPFLFAITYAISVRKNDVLKNLQLIPGVFVTLSVSGLWGWLLIKGGHSTYLHNIIFEQIIGRSVGSDAHSQPIYFYALVLLPAMMPWFPFILRGYRRSTTEIRSVVLAWFLPGFILISLVHGKLFIYLLPLLPPLFMLAAIGVLELHETGEKPGAWEKYTGGIFFTITGVGLLTVLLVKAPTDLRPLTVPAFMLLAVGAIETILASREKIRTIMYSNVAAATIISWLVLGFGTVILNNYLSPRSVGTALAILKKEGYDTVAYNVTYGIFGFYSGFPIRHISQSQLAEIATNPEHQTAILMRNKRVRQLPDEIIKHLRKYRSFPHPHRDGYTIYTCCQ